MSKLYLKGVNKPITITREEAKSVNKAKEDIKISKNDEIVLRSTGMRFEKGDVRYAIENDIEDDEADRKEIQKEENEEYHIEVDKEYKKHITFLCNRPIQEKAKDTSLFSIMYFSVNGITPPQEIKDKVEAMQMEYFKVNPKHPYAKVNFFTFLDGFKKEKENGIVEMVGRRGINMTERIIVTAFYEAFKLKLI